MERFTVEDESIEIDRLYRDSAGRWYPSVSTVLDVRPMPEALVTWLEQTDDAEAINRYRRNRGTIVHYECLNPLYRQAVDDPTADLWGGDEANSKQQLQADGRWAEAEEDASWARETFELIQDIYNIETILDVETYVKHTDIRVAGQFDLLYQDTRTDETVIVDLKTGKYVYEESKDQLSCYAHAVDVQVDRAEIIRFNPEYDDWEVSCSHDWERSLEECFDDYCATRTEFAQEYDLDLAIEQLEAKIASGEIVPDSQVPA